MTKHSWLLTLACTLAASPAWAQKDDAPIPYEDDTAQSDDPATAKPKRRKHRLREDDEDAKERNETMTHVDDPNLGLGGEVFSGVMLLESSRGAGVDPRFTFGTRFTWEFGRLIPDEFLREMFFADVQWQFSVTSDGTTYVHASSAEHYFSVAPAFALPFGNKSPIAAYVQTGVGFNANFTSIVIDKTETPITGGKFLFQYGIGIRGRPALLDDGSVRISFRIEITRYLRGYMSDTFIGAGVGLMF